MLILRSIAFNALFYLNTIIYLIIGLPTFFMPYRAIVGVAKSWGRTNLVLLRVVAGIDCEIRGREKIPKGPLIVASKHQSAWETFALLPLLENPVFILKRELQLIPIFGWLTIKGRMGRVDRLVAIPEVGACEQIEQIIRARAADNAVGIEPESVTDRFAQCRRRAVRIILEMFADRAVGGDRVRARPQRGFVGGQLEHFGDSRRGALARNIGGDVEHAGARLRAVRSH